jgi:polyferredoxin
MNHTLPYQTLADAVLLLHFAIVLFIVGGFAFILVGGLRGWALIRKRWFRILHLLAITIVVAQAWLGELCPLTTLEVWLRDKAHEVTYSGSFIEHWLQRVLYYQAPSWVFTLVYSAFGLAVLLTWLYFPPSAEPSPNKPKEDS